MFGINAELLIDHAWGYEPTTIDLIKAYKPETPLPFWRLRTCRPSRNKHAPPNRQPKPRTKKL